MAHRFIPWVKTGIGSATLVEDTLSEALPSSNTLPVSLRINNRHDAAVTIQLFGPGDIVGINHLEIVRTDPRQFSSDFEPTYFPAVEFRRPDFPWMFTPATGDARGRLRPWLCLVAVRVQDGVQIAVHRNRPLPTLTIAAPARPAAELPDLAESWAWAHAQASDTSDTSALDELLKGGTTGAISRVVCPVKLTVNSRYYACLVPTFETGRLAGLGAAADDVDTLTAAWQSGQQSAATVELPVYYHWEFTTGAGGDFESLAHRLRGEPLRAGVGSCDVDVKGLGFGLPDLGRITFEGALRATTAAPGPSPPASPRFEERLREILNTPAALNDTGDPVVAPTMYGAFHAATRQVPNPGGTPFWLRDVNLDPRHRAAAGLGTVVIRDRQEQLMASAWQQLPVLETDIVFERRAGLALEVSRRVFSKHLAPLGEAALLDVTTPVHAVVSTGPGTAALTAGTQASTPVTLATRLQTTPIPRGVFSPAFRSIVRRGGPIMSRVAAPSIPILQRLVDRPAPLTRTTAAAAHVTRAQIQRQLDAARARGASGVTLPPETTRFLAAADELRVYLETLPLPPPVAVLGPGGPLASVKDTVLRQLEPGPKPATKAGVLAVAGAAAADETSTVLRHPEFPQPMYTALRDLSTEFLLAGAENVGEDMVTLVETNPRFIESFMLGLNHEMSRELAWREYPTDQRGTYFTRFWGDGEASQAPPPQMPPIHRWDPQAPLGASFMSGRPEGRLVVLIRGALLRRYPSTVVYAAKADPSNGRIGDAISPILRGRLEPDIVFLGFDLTEAAARGGGDDLGYYFVLEEPETEARFGLDIADEFGASVESLLSWNQVTWGHVVPDAHAFENLTHVPLGGRLSSKRLDGAEWGFNSAHMALITLQKRVRVAIHASRLLPSRA